VAKFKSAIFKNTIIEVYLLEITGKEVTVRKDNMFVGATDKL